MRATLIAAVILAGSALIGDWLLRTLAISLPAFRIAGGLLLFSIASEMVFGVRIERQSQAGRAGDRGARAQRRRLPARHSADGRARRDHRHGAAAGRSDGDPMRLGILLAVIAFVAALCAVVFLLCTHIGRLLGVTGNIVLSRLLGVLLAALAVQYVIDGVRAALA